MRVPLAWVAMAAFLLSGAAVRPSPRIALALMWIGLVAGGALASPVLARSQSLSLLVALFAIGGSLALGRGTDSAAPPFRSQDGSAWTARGAAVSSTTIWLLVAGGGIVRAGAPTIALGAAALVACIAVGHWIVTCGPLHSTRRALLFALAIVLAGTLPFLTGRWSTFFGVVAVFPAISVLILPFGRQLPDETVDWLDILFSHPPRLLVVTFAVLCAAGTIALSLPFSSATGRPIPYVDALFTAVSAVCVTGLVVVDTPVAFSAAGQAIIAVLIQLGALGIMTFSTAALGLLGRRLSLVHEGAVAGLITGSEQGRLYAAVKRVLGVTLVIEAAGALILGAFFWIAGDPPETALGRGVFTAISAFCNAGFALQSDSLVPYAHSAGIIHTVGTLVLLGGLSPFLVIRMHKVLSGRHSRAQEKLVLTATAILLITGALLFAAFEWNASLSRLSVGDKLTNAIFQSVTLRTAGFNTVDFGQMTAPTVAVMLLWMFIGGSPGSAAGGIKTTTAAVLVLAVLATIRGHSAAVVFHRRVPHSTIYRATAIATTGAAVVFLAFLAIVLTQDMPSSLALFEVVSALGTVGLSLGGTGRLDDLGKLMIVACMFAGRLGPLTLFMFLTRKAAREWSTRPQEDIQVG